jgi:hypothetical protein
MANDMAARSGGSALVGVRATENGAARPDFACMHDVDVIRSIASPSRENAWGRVG